MSLVIFKTYTSHNQNSPVVVGVSLEITGAMMTIYDSSIPLKGTG